MDPLNPFERKTFREREIKRIEKIQKQSDPHSINITLNDFHATNDVGERFARQSMELMHGTVRAGVDRYAALAVQIAVLFGLMELFSGRFPDVICYPVFMIAFVAIIRKLVQEVMLRIDYNTPQGFVMIKTHSGRTGTYPIMALMDYEIRYCGWIPPFPVLSLARKRRGGRHLVTREYLVLHLPEGNDVWLATHMLGGYAGLSEFRSFLDLYRRYLYDPEELLASEPVMQTDPEPMKEPEPVKTPEPAKQQPVKKPAPVRMPEPTKMPEPVKMPVFTERPVMPERSNEAFPDPTGFSGGFPDPATSFPDPAMSFPDPAASFPDSAQSFPDPAASFPDPAASFPDPIMKPDSTLP